MFEELLASKVVAAGGNDDITKELIHLSTRLAERGGFDKDSIMLIVIDSIGARFSRDAIIKQLRINCGEFDFLPR